MPEDKKICFVVGPIGEPDSDTRIHADWLLEEIIQPVLAGFETFDVVRADKIAAPGMIDAQVIGHLLESEIVIADLSGLNPNAFYEIGLRHMIQKPIVHMQLADDKIPFDVSLYRAIKFSRIRPADIRRAREDLKAALNSIVSPTYKVDNPVTRAQGQINLDLQASPSERVLVDQIRALQQRLSIIEDRAILSGDLDDRSFVNDALNVDHEKWGPNKAASFHGFLNGLFGEKIRSLKTLQTRTYADVDMSDMDVASIKRFEKLIEEYPGVNAVALIPF